MKALTLEEIQKSELETLLIFRDFCEKNHLRYYLTFGTLLGAVRHQGFIPWDDDVDVFMPRADYDFLIRHFNEAAICSRELLAKETNPTFYMGNAKIIDRNTSVVEEYRDLEIGVWIDIFPMDYITDDQTVWETQNKAIAKLNRWIYYSTFQPRKELGWYKNCTGRFFHRVCPPIDRLCKERAERVAVLQSVRESHTYGLFYRNFGKRGIPVLPVSLFDPAVKLPFEGELFTVPKEYDILLKHCYGSYMTLPPPKKRVSHHQYSCFWKEEVSA